MSPFRYDWIARYTRAEARRTREIVRRLRPVTAPTTSREVLAANWSMVLGGALQAWPDVPTITPVASWAASRTSTTWAAIAEHDQLGTLAFAVDADFARAIADRALGVVDRAPGAADGFTVQTNANPSHRADASLTDAREGALLVIAAHASVLATTPSPPPRVRAVTSRVDDVVAALDAPSVVVWPWKLAAGLLAAQGAIVLSAERLARSPPVACPWSVDVFADANVTFDVVLGRDKWRGVELLKLSPGDVLALDDRVRVGDGDTVVGEVRLSSTTVDVPLRWEEGRATLAGPAQRRSRVVSDTDERISDTRTDAGPAVRTQIVSELPMEIDVVIGRATFSLGDVGAWRVGEVIEMNTRIGEHVQVRAGGRPVARGELVEVDGAVGVRITELL